MSLGSAWRYAWRSAWVLPVIAVAMFVVAELLGEPWPTIVWVLCFGIPVGLLALLSVIYAARWIWRARNARRTHG